MFLIFIYCGFKIETEPFETETDPMVRLRLRFLILKTEHLRFRLRFYPKTAPIRTVLSPSLNPLAPSVLNCNCLYRGMRARHAFYYFHKYSLKNYIEFF